MKLRFPNVQISRWRSAKPGCRSWKRVIASRSDAPADCVRARARGGYSVSRRSRKSVAAPPAPICEHGSSFSEVGKTGSPVTAPRSDAPADCVRARARDADALRDGRENRSPPASHTAYATRSHMRIELFGSRRKQAAGHAGTGRSPIEAASHSRHGAGCQVECQCTHLMPTVNPAAGPARRPRPRDRGWDRLPGTAGGHWHRPIAEDRQLG